jgi:hypothetical protein
MSERGTNGGQQGNSARKHSMQTMAMVPPTHLPTHSLTRSPQHQTLPGP